MLEKNEALKISRTESGTSVEMLGGKKTMLRVLYIMSNSARKIGVTEAELLEAIIFGYADERGTAVHIEGLRRDSNEQNASENNDD